MINLEWLRTFRAVYRTKSLSRASEILSISQPTVSQQIFNLEAHLGHKLFIRKSKGVIETDDGKLLNTLVSGSIESLEEIEHLIVQKQSQLKSIVSIGISSHLYKSVLCRKIFSIGDSVHIQFGTKQSLITDVEEGRLLYAIIPGEVNTFDIICNSLRDQQLILVATPDISLNEIIKIYKNDKENAEKLLSNYPWFAHDAAVGYIKLYWMSVFNKKRPSIIPTCIIPNEYEVLYQLAQSSGISIALEVNASPFIDSKKLVKWNFSEVPFRKLSLISNKKKAPKSVTQNILNLLTDSVEDENGVC